MSGTRRDSDNKKEGGGLGFGSAVLLGAGAAAVGFLASELWSSYKEFQAQGQPSCSSRPRPPPPGSASEWENKTDKNLGARKKQRESFRDNNTPDEMKCLVCYDNPREVCLIPCGHVCLCEDCVVKVESECGSKCPMCQTRFTNKKAIYL